MNDAAGYPPVNPNTWHFIEYVMKPLAVRKLAGEDPEVIARELVEQIYPWLWRQITRETATPPRGADPAEITSHMLESAWKSALKYDPTCPQSWPTGLKQSLKGAWLDAYRAVDYYTRKHRSLHNKYRAHLERHENLVGHQLDTNERLALAREIMPPSKSTDWAAVVVLQSPPPPVGAQPVDWELLGPALRQPHHDDPAHLACDTDVQDKINHWIAQMPEKLAADVYSALQRGTRIRVNALRKLIQLFGEGLGLEEVDVDLAQIVRSQLTITTV